jgi:hypothetical protein
MGGGGGGGGGVSVSEGGKNTDKRNTVYMHIYKHMMTTTYADGRHVLEGRVGGRTVAAALAIHLPHMHNAILAHGSDALVGVLLRVLTSPVGAGVVQVHDGSLVHV